MHNTFTRMIKLTAVALAAILFTVCLTACKKQEAAANNQEKAIGVLIVNGKPTLSSAKVYAEKANNSYSFPLDAACVYFFDADAETSYAGEQNLTSLTFGANIDSDNVGAKGQIAYRYSAESENTVNAYYLYYDGEGVYFSPEKAFQTSSVNEALVLTGTDYTCSIEFFFCEPAEQFKVTMRDSTNAPLSEETYKATDIEDYQKLIVPKDAVTVEWVSYAVDGTELYNDSLRSNSNNFVICYDNGGQILASKLIQLVWQQ